MVRNGKCAGLELPEGTAQASARERIMTAAAHLYGVHGYDGTSIRDIAERAGVTKPLIYYHFESKERLYGSIFRFAMDCAFQEVAEILQTEAGPKERLRELIRAQVALARRAPEIYFFVHAALTMPGLLPLGFDYKEEGRRYMDLFRQVVVDGQRSGDFRDLPADLVIAAPSGALGIVVARILSGDLEAIPGNFEEKVLELLAGGVEVSRG